MMLPLVYRYRKDPEVNDNVRSRVDLDLMIETITNETWRKAALLKIQDRLNELYEEVIKECPAKEEPAGPEQSEKR